MSFHGKENKWLNHGDGDLDLNPTEEAVWRQVQQLRTVEEISKRTGLPEDLVKSTIDRLNNGKLTKGQIVPNSNNGRIYRLGVRPEDRRALRRGRRGRR